MKYLSEFGGHETDERFINAVDEWVSRAYQQRTLNFGEILKSLPGVYPGEVLASVRRLSGRGELTSDRLQAVLRETKRRRKLAEQPSYEVQTSSRLEHPLDFEWLFSKEAKGKIIETVNDLARGQKWTVLCLGCPSIFKMGSQLNIHNFRLLDKNAASWGQLSEAKALTNIDLLHDAVPDLQIDAAIIDPPWYNDFYRLFIWSALMLARPGAKLLVSVPQIGTRPSCEEDLANLLEWCSDAGLRLLHHHRSHLSYRAPLFEMNALKAQGIHNVPYDWRRGDLLVLEKIRSTVTPRPPNALAGEAWLEYHSGLVRYKLKTGPGTGSVPALRPVVRNAVIPSVSTRFPGRGPANFVTSGNRFFVASSTEILAGLCDELSGSSGARFRTLSSTDKHFNVRERMRIRLQSLFQLEQREAEIYLAETQNV